VIPADSDRVRATFAVDVSAVCSSYFAVFEFGGEPSKIEKFAIAREALVQFHDYFDGKQIWLPAECCEKVRALQDELRKLFNDFAFDQ
jgi:hypothetical protein